MPSVAVILEYVAVELKIKSVKRGYKNNPYILNILFSGLTPNSDIKNANSAKTAKLTKTGWDLIILYIFILHLYLVVLYLFLIQQHELVSKFHNILILYILIEILA